MPLHNAPIAIHPPEPASNPTTDPQPDFPLHILPPIVREYIERSSLHTRVPPEMIALPFLAFTGGLIGSRLRIQVGPTWFERPALWIALVSPIGTGKSPAIRAARHPFDTLQEAFRAAHQPPPKTTAHEWLEKQLADARLPKPPPPPATPEPIRVFTSQIAFDDLANVLASASGITIVHDELIGLVRIFNRHGGDLRHRYLSLWSSESITAVGHNGHDLWIPNPVVSIVGGLQPSLLHRLRSREQDGMLERFLPISIEKRQRYWIEAGDAAPDLAPVANLIEQLAFLSHDPPEGAIVQRSPRANLAWTSWFNDNVDRTTNAETSIHGFYNKLPAHISRFALILHALWNPDVPTSPISEETMRHAITLGEFVRTHIHRTMAILTVSQPNGDPKPSLGAKILRALTKTSEPDGWLGRTALLVALGRPDKSTFDSTIQQLIATNQVEHKIRPSPKQGPITNYYRLVHQPST